MSTGFWVSEVLRKLDDRLFLIGVAHVLPKSADEVKEIISRERPDVVAVELDPIRYLALTQAGQRLGAIDAIRAGPKLLPLVGLLYLLQNKFSHQTGMPAGEEMLVAIQHAREVKARVEFIDQNIGITLQRLIDRMPWRERLRLFGELVIGLLPFGKRVELGRLTDEQVVNCLLEELRRSSPTAYDVLITERDAYMSSRVAMLLSAGNRVVCVVGAGHVPGIYSRLKKISSGWGIKLEYRVGG